MQKIEFRTPNRMKFDSEFKTFNADCDLITTGNVISNVLYSSYISKDYGLEQFYYINKCPQFIICEIKNRIETGAKVILYCLKLRGSPVAWILTDSDHNLITKCRAGLHQYAKETSVMNEAVKYLTNQG